MDVPINDLYSGLNIPPQTKRQREDEAKKKNDNHDKEDDRTTATDLSATVKRPRLAKKPRGIFDTMKKLEKHLLVDKTFAKASALFSKFISDHLTVESSALFLQTLTTVMDEKRETLSCKTEWKELQTLAEMLDTKRDVILSVRDGNERRERERKLDAWKFSVVTHKQLCTDETYQFNKAAKAVKLRFEEMVNKEKGQEEVELAHELHTELMPLLRTLSNKVNVAWAATIVEGVLALATRHRLLFNAQDCVEIDAWTKTMKDRRSAPAVARSAASDARRNIVAVDGYEHSEAGAKVPGRYNHPLFNKEI